MIPLIGVTFRREAENRRRNNYIRAVEMYGGVPVAVYPGVPDSELREIHGLLLTGGGDVHPRFFGQEWHPSLKFVREERDEMELPLCKRALEANLPVFGICRGIQVMSIAMDGDLYQDVPSQFSAPLPHSVKKRGVDARHEIEIEPGSLLCEVIGGQTSDTVNSDHHQAVDDIGEGFIVTARSGDGVIEAIENPSKRFALGVQYHPERMIQTAEFLEHRRKLFEAFIGAASDALAFRVAG